MNSNFSNVKYRDVASFVGLDRLRGFYDIPSSDLCRSRIPTALLRDVVMDMDVLFQYGTHNTEFLTTNTQESLMGDCNTTRDRVTYYFKAFGALTFVVEVKPKFENEEGLLNAIAQVIVESCDWNNAQVDLSVPIYGILCDGSRFQFLTFDGSTKPYKVSIRVVRDSPFLHFVRRGLPLVDCSCEPTARAFVHDLRQICESVFNFFLLVYIASLKAFRSRHVGQQKSLDGWDKVLKFAEKTLEKSQDAEALRQDNSITDADATTETAFKSLKLSTDAVPIAKDYTNPHLMDGWKEEVAEV
ncbi:hypothetical protein EDB86DRAFT_2826090 [Lactarius hatsudake]|nr:hypothetical protein EDB86DRAFT_2826090 [Lactarius hatsudake]